MKKTFIVLMSLISMITYGQMENKSTSKEVTLNIQSNVDLREGKGFKLLVENWGSNSTYEINIIQPSGEIIEIKNDHFKSDVNGTFIINIPYEYKGGIESGINILLVAGEIGIHVIQFEVPKAENTISDRQLKQIQFCVEFTENALGSSENFKKSYFSCDGDNTFIQVMYLDEMAKDTSVNYNILHKEAREKGYLSTLASMSLKSYQNHGLTTVLMDNKFTHFQILLIDTNNEEIASKKLIISN